jgi:hypothetical protein
MEQAKLNEIKGMLKKTLSLLDEAEKNLRSARNWGIYDILGGKLFSGLIKHSKIDRAQKLMGRLHRNLNLLQKEFKDFNSSVSDDLGMSGISRFMDIAFDNLISDWLIQSRINKSLSELDELRSDLNRALNQLEKM